MKSLSPELAGDIMAGFAVTVVSVQRLDGVTALFTNYDSPLKMASGVYLPAAGLSGITLTLTNNMSVSTQETAAAWLLPYVSEADVLAGIYDNCYVRLGIASWRAPGYGILWLFSGQLSSVNANADGFQAEVQSAQWVLQRPLGISSQPKCRHKFGGTSDVNGVWGCQVDASTYMRTGTIVGLVNPMVWEVDIPGWENSNMSNTPSAPTVSVQENVVGQYIPPGHYGWSVSSIDEYGQESSTSPITTADIVAGTAGVGGGVVTLNWAAVPNAVSYNVYGRTAQELLYNTSATSWTDDGEIGSTGFPPLFGDYFAEGEVIMTSGAANTLRGVVKTLQGQTLYILLPIGRPVAIGDTFTITPGCAKTASACLHKFGNLVNFGGEPDLTPQRNWQ